MDVVKGAICRVYSEKGLLVSVACNWAPRLIRPTPEVEISKRHDSKLGGSHKNAQRVWCFKHPNSRLINLQSSSPLLRWSNVVNEVTRCYCPPLFWIEKQTYILYFTEGGTASAPFRNCVSNVGLESVSTTLGCACGVFDTEQLSVARLVCVWFFLPGLFSRRPINACAGAQAVNSRGALTPT